MCHSLNVVLFEVFLITFVRTILAECGGKTLIYDLFNGTITLAADSDKYSPNTHCEWLIKAPQPSQKIQLTFSHFDTECSFDYVKVYDGLSSQKLLGAFSGSTVPPSLISTTSSIVLEFFSDNNYVRDGCIINFVITDCPGNCSDRGSCIDNKCNCDELYTGEACEIDICPQWCNNFTGNGQCSQSGGCHCSPDFVGQSCSVSLRDDVDTGSWHLIRDNSPVFQNRFGHAGVYVELDNSFWVFGGSNLNEVFNDLVKFDFNENNWQLIEPSGYRPAARFRHTLVIYKHNLVLFGGELANGTLLNDLWMFNISTSTWTRYDGNNPDSPPALASHCAAVGAGKLIIFGGQTKDYEFSYYMYTYDLVLQNGWKTVTYKLAKISDLRLVGHTCVFYQALRSLIVFGGYKIETGRRSTKRDTLLVYHMEGKVWFPFVASDPPKPRAYHSSVIMGDYMVIYGGVVHTHYKDETCYGDDIYLFNLKNFTWLSLLSSGGTRNGSSSNIRGRYSHVASVFNQSTLLISGGFSGLANGDFLAYKMPSNIIRGDLSSTHMCHVFSQCVPCLTWGSQSDLQCGWCVQDSRCYPRSTPSGPCTPNQTSWGWWGDKGSFLTTVNQCRIEDNPPGLISSISFGKSLDDIYLRNPLGEIFFTSPRRLTSLPKTKYINVKWFGFIYPFLSQPTSDTILLKLRIGTISASLRLSTDELKENMEKVISVKSERKEEILLSKEAKRQSGLPLFPNATKNKMYYIEVNTEMETTTINPYLQVLRNHMLINGSYVRPYYSDDCGKYMTCLECLLDVSCGWCSSSNACLLRNSSKKCHNSFTSEEVYLILNATYCETCAQYVDCSSCSKDDLCIWRRVHEKMLYESCESLEAQESNVVKTCTLPCASHTDCKSCAMSTKCLWCQKTHECIPWTSYPVAFMHGQCSHWSDVFTTTEVRCSSCNQLNVCADCWKTRHCGWCGEFHNGSCFAGGYEAPYSGSCNQLIPHGTNNSHVWSYGECPDENECITRRDCHENADCFNTIGSYKCECHQGYEGNGTFCKALCNPPCVHGNCIKHESNESLDKCDCDLGWTGPVCSLDCGCYNHSTCHTGTGICDNCQDLTYGSKCEFCVRGSYGNATTRAGCKKCECNGHGDEQRGICDDKTGHCFCMNNTMGTYCDQCLPGFSGYPERAEGCYYPCKAHSILSNLTQGTLSSLPEIGRNRDSNDVNCVWIITTLPDKSNHVVYSSKVALGTITFRMKDIALDCQTEHVYVYDGMPNYKVNLFGTKSSFNLIGSLCGSDASNIPVIETSSGTLVVVFKGNVGQNSQSTGFNASFVVNQCPNTCTGNRYCRSNGTHESCVCKPGWTGSACDHAICPANCSEDLGQGLCDDNSGKCICKSGYSGPSCNVRHPFDDFIWEYTSDVSGSTSALARMGHSLVADHHTESLIIYGGYSFYRGILGDIWRFDTKTNNYSQDQNWSTMPSPRYFHAADVYKRTMYITGGITERGYSSEVWKYDLNTKQWQIAQSLPREMAGHTVNVINNKMYVIGGYSPWKQCSSNVFTLQLHVIGSPWSDLNPSGDVFDACFGHTTAYDNVTNSLVVFGKKAMKMKPTLAVLKLTTNEWVVIPEVPKVFLRYFHVSMIVGDVMIVTTGYTGTDVQDFADQPIMYDLGCGRWHKAQLKGEAPSFLAHSAIASMNGIAYVFGGYNGVSSDNLFHQNISSNWCAVFSTESSCSGVRRCVWCQDTTTNLTACYTANSYPHLNCSAKGNDGNCENGGFAMAIASYVTSWNDVCIGNSVPGGCSRCLQDDTSSRCSWSVDSQLCFSLDFQPITCAFGICGRVLRHYDECLMSCSGSSYCYDCLEQYNCGWCTDDNQNGDGFCTEGTLQGPYNGSCMRDNENLAKWVSSVCLPENECVNGNHKCNENEICIDLDSSYKCECLAGYETRNGSCAPVCNQGCVNGTCIAPDQCSCNFGWVGANCSIACQCNGQGHCVNEHQLDNCTDCQGYTTGISCHRCLPRYVGQQGACKSCNEECHGNADVCYDVNKKNTTEGRLYGAKDNYYLKCECKDNSEGALCESCKPGYFKSNQKCVKCKCRGHSASCNAETGLNCNCQNKTRTPENGGNTKQCSICISPYLGSPDVEGQQCYRDLRILRHLSLAREHSKLTKYTNLLPFQTSFYYIFPSFTNADIRLTIDISYGILDVYISYADNAFKVDPNQNVSIALTEVTHPELYSDGLNTYATFSGGTQVVVFKEIKHRLVVTFPYDEHRMDKNKFYIVIKAGLSGANGIIYFKQDNTKINLIVFFIVFASCFVFILSAITIAWSMKNHIHSQRDRIIQQVENERLHNRPFAKYPFLFEYQAPGPSVIRHRKTTASTRKALRPMAVQGTSDYHAAVTTVIFQMPQTDKTKMSLSLGTTLALITPQQLDKLAQPSSKLNETTSV